MDDLDLAFQGHLADFLKYGFRTLTLLTVQLQIYETLWEHSYYRAVRGVSVLITLTYFSRSHEVFENLPFLDFSLHINLIEVEY